MVEGKGRDVCGPGRERPKTRLRWEVRLVGRPGKLLMIKGTMGRKERRRKEKKGRGEGNGVRDGLRGWAARVGLKQGSPSSRDRGSIDDT